MKLQWTLWTVALGASLMLGGCAGKAKDGSKGEVRVLCSFFPMHQFVQNITNGVDGIAVELMLPAQSGCPHDHDLTTADVRKIVDADIYVMNGKGLESFGVDAVKNANPDIRIVDASDGIETIELAEEHHHHEGEEDHHHHHHSHEGGVNPHFFSSPRAAAVQVRNIAGALAEALPSQAEKLRQNGEAYAMKLEGIAKAMSEAVEGRPNNRIVTMHEVFDYLARDCGLSVVGTIHGGAGQEPSPREMRELIESIRESKPAAIFTEPQYAREVAVTVAKEAGVPVDELDPVASGPPNAPRDYYESAMRRNADTLTRVLSSAP